MKFIQALRKTVREGLTKAEKIFTNAGRVNHNNAGFINLIDVGAIGELPDPWFKNAKYISNLLRFEPREEASVHPNIISLDYALGSKNEMRPFYIYQGNYSHGSSFYLQNMAFVDANFDQLKLKGSPKLANTWHERSKLIKTIELQCKTLDTVLAELKLDFSFDFLKIDAQGAEYEILTGSEKFLAEHCLGLQLELFNLPMYQGIKLKDEVIGFLSARGFELVKEFDFHGTFNCANDCIFLRKNYKPEDKKKIDLFRQLYGV